MVTASAVTVSAPPVVDNPIVVDVAFVRLTLDAAPFVLNDTVPDIEFPALESVIVLVAADAVEMTQLPLLRLLASVIYYLQNKLH